MLGPHRETYISEIYCPGPLSHIAIEGNKRLCYVVANDRAENEGIPNDYVHSVLSSRFFLTNLPKLGRASVIQDRLCLRIFP